MKKIKNPMNIFFTTTFKLCDNNGYLSTQIHNFFILNGHHMAETPEPADVIVISTCGFDQERENRSFSIVEQFIEKFSERKKIIICGCLTKINPSLFDLSQVDLIGPKELHKFNDIFHPTVRIENVSGGDLNDRFIDGHYGLLDTYYLQICQGCVNNCSYCAIKKAKGNVTSKSIDSVIYEIIQGQEKGYRRFMLLGDDCGSYGADIGLDFADLLNSLKTFDIRLTVNYIEPKGFQNIYHKIDQKVFEQIDFMNIPIQSTSKRILDLMDRHYKVAEITKNVRDIKAKNPHIFLETHVIYGFPSETREEFQDSFRLVDSFDSVIYFYYTDRKNVRASSLTGKLLCDEIIHRTHEIMSRPEFSKERITAKPPVIILGYSLSEVELCQSIRNNCSSKNA